MSKEIKPTPTPRAGEEAKKKQATQMRQVIIETDGNKITLVKNETAGILELVALLQTILGNINKTN